MPKRLFKRSPVCEACHAEPATSFSYFDRKNDAALDGWHFTGNCTADYERYYIELDHFFKTPATTTDWLAHMHEKTWMDWNDFAKMFHRFRKATESFNLI